MPMQRERYPADWEAISKRIRFERAQGKCEWCGAPNGLYVRRLPDGTFDTWTNCEPDRDDYGKPFYVAWQEEEGERCSEMYDFSPFERPVKIVLTVAHINHDTTDNDDGNLAALCQRCHLTHDAKLHAQHAAETRRKQRIEAGQQELF